MKAKINSLSNYTKMKKTLYLHYIKSNSFIKINVPII